jgi:hypothetical protein
VDFSYTCTIAVINRTLPQIRFEQRLRLLCKVNHFYGEAQNATVQFPQYFFRNVITENKGIVYVEVTLTIAVNVAIQRPISDLLYLPYLSGERSLFRAYLKAWSMLIVMLLAP